MNALCDASTQTEIEAANLGEKRQVSYSTKSSQTTQTSTNELSAFSQDDTLLLGTQVFPKTGLNLEFDLSSPAPLNQDLGFLNQVGILQPTGAEVTDVGFLDNLEPTISPEKSHVRFLDTLEPIIIDSEEDIFENFSDNGIHFDEYLFEDDNTACRYDKFATELGTEQRATSNLRKAASDSAFGTDICWTVCVLCRESYFDFYTVPCSFCKGGICDDCFYKSHYIHVVENRLKSISVIEGGCLDAFARLYIVCSESCGTQLKSLIAD